jgi:hypothetical protein
VIRRRGALALVLVAVAAALGAAACSGSSASPADRAAPGTDVRPTPRTDPQADADQFKDAATIAQRADSLLGTDQCFQTGAAFSAIVAEPTALAAGGATDEQVDQFRQDIESLKPQIPDQLKGDFDTLAAAYETAATELTGLSTLSTTPDASDLVQRTKDAQHGLARLEDPAVKQAEQHLTAYFDACTTQLTR